jgi:hypothetical protein
VKLDDDPLSVHQGAVEVVPLVKSRVSPGPEETVAEIEQGADAFLEPFRTNQDIEVREVSREIGAVMSCGEQGRALEQDRLGSGGLEGRGDLPELPEE